MNLQPCGDVLSSSHITLEGNLKGKEQKQWASWDVWVVYQTDCNEQVVPQKEYQAERQYSTRVLTVVVLI